MSREIVERDMRTAEANISDLTAKASTSHLSDRTLKRLSIVVGLMLVAYLVGFVPGWLSSKGFEGEIARLKESNSAHTLKADLAAATMHARQGRFDEAIVAAGSFFNRMDKEIVAADGILNNEPAIGEAAANMLARRDEMISMLARGDEGAADVLAGWYFELEQATNGGK